jgi:hypothetical protein
MSVNYGFNWLANTSLSQCFQQSSGYYYKPWICPYLEVEWWALPNGFWGQDVSPIGCSGVHEGVVPLSRLACQPNASF